MDTISFVNHKIVKRWKEWGGTLKDFDEHLLIPLLYPSMEQGVLLFVGSNPSFVPEAYQAILKERNYIAPEAFLSWSNYGKYTIEEYRDVEKQVRKSYHRFFGVFEVISKNVGLKWEHVDLFFYRETEQNRFKSKVYDSKTKNLTTFGRGQLDLSKQLINAVKPKVVVVANKFASDIFREELDLKWDEERGYYLTFLNNENVPIFLASMLSGQRAMDLYSRERLVWHIKKAIMETANE